MFHRHWKLAVCGGILLLAVSMWGLPQFYVYMATFQGRAELKRAEQNRQIRVEEARAASESATLLAEAEIRRARGVAEANKIIGESLKGNEAYLRYLWINGLHEGKNQHTIYVPTEAGLPILEAGRFGRVPGEEMKSAELPK